MRSFILLLALLPIVFTFYLSAEDAERMFNDEEQQPMKRELDEEEMIMRMIRDDRLTRVFVEEFDETETIKIRRMVTEEQMLQTMNDEIKEEEQISNFQGDSLLQ